MICDNCTVKLVVESGSLSGSTPTLTVFTWNREVLKAANDNWSTATQPPLSQFVPPVCFGIRSVQRDNSASLSTSISACNNMLVYVVFV